MALGLVGLGLVLPWLLRVGPGLPDRVPTGVLPIPGGELRIDRLVEVPDHGQMPGMMVADERPEGSRRISVEATIVATGGEPVRYDGREFLVSAAGFEARPPSRAAPGPATVPTGAAIAVRLLFDVPESATGLRLGHGRADASVPLAATSPGPHDEGGTEGEGHDR